MPLYAFEDCTPNVHPDAFIAPTAVLVGDVDVEAGASIWFGTVLRADVAPIVIRAGATIHDGTSIYASFGLTVEVGAGATVGQGVAIRGALIGPGAVIGTGSVVLEAVTVGAGAFVAAGSVVPARSQIPEGYLASGSPAILKRPVKGSPGENFVVGSAADSAQLAHRHRAGLRAV